MFAADRNESGAFWGPARRPRPKRVFYRGNMAAAAAVALTDALISPFLSLLRRSLRLLKGERSDRAAPPSVRVYLPASALASPRTLGRHAAACDIIARGHFRRR